MTFHNGTKKENRLAYNPDDPSILRNDWMNYKQWDVMRPYFNVEARSEQDMAHHELEERDDHLAYKHPWIEGDSLSYLNTVQWLDEDDGRIYSNMTTRPYLLIGTMVQNFIKHLDMQ